MSKAMSEMPDAELDGHLQELRGCRSRATDLFSQMLLTGKIKAVHRELDKRADAELSRRKKDQP